MRTLDRLRVRRISEANTITIIVDEGTPNQLTIREGPSRKDSFGVLLYNISKAIRNYLDK